MNLAFSKDDILTGLSESMNDSFAKSALVKNMLSAKIKRLKSDLKFEEYQFNQKYGSVREAKDNWDKYAPKTKRHCNNKIKKLSSLIKQIKKYTEIYNKLGETTFSDADMSKFDAKLKQVFKWEKQESFDELLK